MTVKTTLSFTDRHHQYLKERVGEGIFASTSAAVAAAVERMMEDEAAREAALDAMAEEIRRRAAAPRQGFAGHDETFAAVRGRLGRG